jgi:Cof subfamily protein (haloacid dehalogenase superfamily)
LAQPSSALQAKLERIRLVLMDIDGTLVTAGPSTLENVASQLRRLRRLNVPFSLATGRTIAGSSQLLAHLRMAVDMRLPPAINYNGAVLLSPEDGSLVERHVLPHELVGRAWAACRSLGLWPLIYACHDVVSGPPVETVYVDDAAPPLTEFNRMDTRRVVDVSEVEADVVAILADAGDPDRSADAARTLDAALAPTLRATTSGSKYVEICSPRAGKLSAMERVAALQHIGVEQVMAIGDNLNDLEMIRGAGVGVAVRNAPDEVKAAADYSCSRDSAEGVVEALRMLVRVLQLRNRKHDGGTTWQTRYRTAAGASTEL